MKRPRGSGPASIQSSTALWAEDPRCMALALDAHHQPEPPWMPMSNRFGRGYAPLPRGFRERCRYLIRMLIRKHKGYEVKIAASFNVLSEAGCIIAGFEHFCMH